MGETEYIVTVHTSCDARRPENGEPREPMVDLCVEQFRVRGWGKGEAERKALTAAIELFYTKRESWGFRLPTFQVAQVQLASTYDMQHRLHAMLDEIQKQPDHWADDVLEWNS